MFRIAGVEPDDGVVSMKSGLEGRNNAIGIHPHRRAQRESQ